ncbi:MAG: hypothetical protein ABW194_11975 [Novosphingobium sp.]
MRPPTALLPLLAVAGCAAASASPRPVLAEGRPAGFGDTVAVGSIRVRPLNLVEDSRCPRPVQCIWAGRVRIDARLVGSGRAQTRTLMLGEAAQVGRSSVTLAEVLPPRSAGVGIARADYRFTFRGDSP